VHSYLDSATASGSPGKPLTGIRPTTTMDEPAGRLCQWPFPSPRLGHQQWWWPRPPSPTQPPCAASLPKEVTAVAAVVTVGQGLVTWASAQATPSAMRAAPSLSALATPCAQWHRHPQAAATASRRRAGGAAWQLLARRASSPTCCCAWPPRAAGPGCLASGCTTRRQGQLAWAASLEAPGDRKAARLPVPSRRSLVGPA
jgi:hypothetical protein